MTDNKVATEVFDVGQIDKIIRHRGWELEGEDGYITKRNQSRQEIIPEDLMAGLVDEIGDGLAKVTVGAELGHSKEYGCKAQAFVSISVHCNDDEGTIDRVQAILHGMARKYANQDLEEMIDDRDRYLKRDLAGDNRPDGRMVRANDKPQATGKPAARPKGKIRPRPNYKR